MSALPTDLIPVGKVIDAYHLRGQIKAYAYSGDLTSLSRLTQKSGPNLPQDIWLKPVTPLSAQHLKRMGFSLDDGLFKTQVQKATTQNEAVVLSFANIIDRNHAEALKGAEILVPRESLPTIVEDDTFYWLDLIGCTVAQSNGLILGQVTGLLETGAHDILRIASTAEVQALGEEAELLIPFISQFVGETNINNKQITVDWPLGHQ